MSESPIFDGVRNAICNSSLNVSPNDIQINSRIDEDLGANDSSLWTDLLAKIANQFKLPSFTNCQNRKLRAIISLFPTVGELCDFVEARLCEIA